MKYARIKPLTITSIAAALLSTGFSSGTHAEADAKVSDVEPVILQFPYAPSPRFAGYDAAQERGFYRGAGFKVSVRERSQEVSAASGVLNAQAPYSVASVDWPLLRMQGEPSVVAPLDASPVALEKFTNRYGVEGSTLSMVGRATL